MGLQDWSSWSHHVDSLRDLLGRTSLTHGWFPIAIQLAAAVVLVCAVGRRSRRWRRLWLPVVAVAGAALAVTAHWYLASAGFAGDPAPRALWVWIGLSGLAAGVLLVGWTGARWPRRTLSVLAAPLCLLSAGLVLNLWVGYFPTMHDAWGQFTRAPVPDQTDRMTVTAMQLEGAVPAQGVVVPVNVGADASKFGHRAELVYLPPAWFASYPPPQLPVVMMVGGEFNTPTDWIRAGDATKTADGFAAGHGGNAPVLVLVDSDGGFNVDTECVNGTRGNAADHLTKDVVPYMISNFGVSSDRARWGVVGFSSGGTCAIDLAVMHPDTFGVFVDIAGDRRPNSGTTAQTITRLFGGNSDAWAAFDPTTVMIRHGPYTGVSGLFATVAGQDDVADSLCGLGRERGIRCAVEPMPGRHDWPFAGKAFAAALPWLAGQLGTPGAPRVPVPETPLSPTALSPTPLGPPGLASEAPTR